METDQAVQVVDVKEYPVAFGIKAGDTGIIAHTYNIRGRIVAMVDFGKAAKQCQKHSRLYPVCTSRLKKV